MEKKTGSVKVNIVHVLVHLSFTFLLIFGIYGCITSPKLSLFDSKAQIYDRSWTYEKEDGSREEFVLPAYLNSNIGEKVTVSTILPDDLVDGLYLCILSGRSFTAYIDGVEIYSFDTSNRQITGDVIKPFFIPIELKESYAGKTFTMVRTDEDCFNGSMNVAYIGNRLGIIRTVISERGVQFIGATLLMLFSLLTVLVFSIIAIRTRRKIPLTNLASGILSISMWIICDSFVFQFAFGKYYIDGVIAYMLALLLAAPFFMYLDGIQEYRYSRVYKCFELLTVINYIVVSILHFADIASYEETLFYTDACLIIYAVFIMTVTFVDFFVQKNHKHGLVMVGMLGMTIMAILEMMVILFKKATNANIALDGLFIMIGMFILLDSAILDQIKIQVKLQTLTREAVAATRAKSDFLANMSHEIRTPINAIMGMNEMILRESNQDSVKEYAKDAKAASENLLEIVNDILDFSKIESGKLEIVNDNYNLGEIISDVTTLVNMKAEDKGLNLKIAVDSKLPTVLYGDDKRVREIMTNILNNAVKYTDKGQIELTVDSVQKEEDVITLKIVVKDTGKGIKAEDIDKIFSGFERVDMVKNKNIEGTGLGLSITKKLVEMLGGSISVESVYGEGSSFIVILPQKIIDASEMGDYRRHRHASKEADDIVKKEFEAENANVLVVDDSALNLRVISKLLKKTKINVTCVTGGQEALELMSRQRFDIILLDHMMPNMDGIETMEASKNLEGNMCVGVPVIALTANAIVGAKEKYLEAGFDDYLSKPVIPDELEEMMLKYLPESKINLRLSE